MSGFWSKKKVACSRCGGRGEVTDTDYVDGAYRTVMVTCPRCKGTGEMIENEWIDKPAGSCRNIW